jgi:hypothetical protein
MTRNRQNARAVPHDCVLALAKNHKARLLKRPNGIEVIDAG